MLLTVMIGSNVRHLALAQYTCMRYPYHRQLRADYRARKVGICYQGPRNDELQQDARGDVFRHCFRAFDVRDLPEYS